jgi:catechol 2,3-dioxygenase-like lactoylglutathione lyase family enzyme
MPRLTAIDHVELTVADPDRSADWWERVLKFRRITGFRQDTFGGWAMVHPSGVTVNVLSHDRTDSDVFDERRVGLDHLSFAVESRDELEAWIDHLDACDVGHSGIIEAHFGPTIVFRDPDNIQLELFAQADDAFDRIATDPARVAQ